MKIYLFLLCFCVFPIVLYFLYFFSGFAFSREGEVFLVNYFVRFLCFVEHLKKNNSRLSPIILARTSCSYGYATL